MKSNVNYNKLRKFVNLLVEQDESEDVYRISPEEYQLLMKLSEYSPGVTKIKKFGGKPLYITGNVNLSNTRATSLGNVVYIDGTLDIHNTEISKIPDGVVKSYIWDSGTPREKLRLKAQRDKWVADNEAKKETGEWEIGASKEANQVHALFQQLVDDGDIETLDEDELEKLNELKRKLERLTKEYDENEDPDESSELYDIISEVENEIEELEDRNNTIYNTIVPQGIYYGYLRVFYVLPLRRNGDYAEYSVGTEKDMDDALESYYDDYVDQVGWEGISEYTIENCLDEDYIVNMAEEDYEQQVRDYPEGYFDDYDYELSSEDEKRIEELERYIETLDEYIDEKKHEIETLDYDPEDEDEYNRQIEELEQFVEEAESNKEKAQEEIEELQDKKEVTDDMIDNKVYELVQNVRRNPLDYLKEMGLYHNNGLENYVDMKCIKEVLAGNGDYEDLNGYDGRYDTQKVDDTWYYVMRVN